MDNDGCSSDDRGYLLPVQSGRWIADAVHLSGPCHVGFRHCGHRDFCEVQSGIWWGQAGFLADGILTVLLSLFLLFNQGFTLLSLPFIFSVWLLFSGINQFVNSFELQRLGVKGWGWLTGAGRTADDRGILLDFRPDCRSGHAEFSGGIFVDLRGRGNHRAGLSVS